MAREIEIFFFRTYLNCILICKEVCQKGCNLLIMNVPVLSSKLKLA